ncbi:hypothetical protein H9P43_006463 [Blastocladiella emersonii ATCC 22665]|nr:hypothetical protein H9P43_006463 [Blastocladiella emersonii ATCC 22665]
MNQTATTLRNTYSNTGTEWADYMPWNDQDETYEVAAAAGDCGATTLDFRVDLEDGAPPPLFKSLAPVPANNTDDPDATAVTSSAPAAVSGCQSHTKEARTSGPAADAACVSLADHYIMSLLNLYKQQEEETKESSEISPAHGTSVD